MNEPAIRLEEQIISLFSDKETFLCQGWILKKEEKYLSVYPLYYRPSEKNIPERIRKCEEIADRYGLECVFRIVEHTNYYLSALLTDNGYTLQRRGEVREWNFSENCDHPGEEKTKAGESLSNELCPGSKKSLKKFFLKQENGGRKAEYLMIENDTCVAIRKREVLFLRGTEPRKELKFADEDIRRFSAENGIARILADLPAGERTTKERECAGFYKVYGYCIYHKSANAENRRYLDGIRYK